MGLLRNVYGLDLGTYEIKVYDRKKDLIWKEKNVIATKEEKYIFASGDEAYAMFEKAPDDIQVVFPMHGGVIAKFDDMQYLLEYLLKKERTFSKGAEYLVAVPTDVTEVESAPFMIWSFILRHGQNRFVLLNEDLQMRSVQVWIYIRPAVYL